MTIFVDVDGVVADLHAGWLKRYNKDYNDNLRVEDITRWAIHEFVKPECGTKIYQYLLDPTLYDDVPEIVGARWGVEKLREMNLDVVFLSAGFYPAKVKWLCNRGFAVDYPYKDGRWDSVRDVILCGRKELLAKSPDDILIDDRPDNGSGFTYSILFDQPWNRDDVFHPYRTGNWQEVIDLIETTKEHRGLHEKKVSQLRLPIS